MIDQHGVWLVVAVIAFGWLVSVVSAIGRASRRLGVVEALPVPVPADAAPAPAAQIASAPPPRLPRAQPVRPLPARADAAPPAAPGRGLAVLLRDGAGIRSGVVLAEVLAPPVSLR